MPARSKARLKSQIVTSSSVVPAERVEQRILSMRGQNLMLDADLAELYGVATKALNQAVRRNIERFPQDFMFQLTQKEVDGLSTYWDSPALRSQTVTSNSRGGRRYRPLAFTEQGVAMLSSVLRSPRAVQVNIAIMRAFVKLRQILATHRDLAQRLEEMESRYDEQFRVMFDAIRELMKTARKAAPSHRFRCTTSLAGETWSACQSSR